jgi:hypothetical protein
MEGIPIKEDRVMIARRCTLVLACLAAMAALAPDAAQAQCCNDAKPTVVPWYPQRCLPSSQPSTIWPVPSVPPSKETTPPSDKPTDPGTTTPPTPNVPEFGSESGAALGRSAAFASNSIVGPGASGAGASAAGASGAGAAGAGIPFVGSVTVTVNSTTQSSIPLILPGLLTSATVQGAVPVDRVFFNYGYLNGFRVGPSSTTNVNTLTVTPSAGANFTAANVTVQGLPANLQPGTTVVQTPGRDAFNLNTYTAGVEKTLLGGLASVYVSVPVLSATDNTSGQPINGIGDVNAGFKIVLYGDHDRTTFWTAGLTVSAPTGQNTTVVTNTQSAFTLNGTGVTTNGTLFFTQTGPVTPVTTLVQTTTINPTYIQPWTAGAWSHNRFFIEEYFGGIIPTDTRVPVNLNQTLTAGFRVFEGVGNSLVTSVTPFVSTQALIPCSGASLAFSDQVFFSGGVGVGLRQRLWLSGSYVTPIAGPRAFGSGFTIGLNYLY